MSKLKSEKREIIKKLKKNHDFLDKLDILLEYNTTLKQYFTKDFFPKMDLTLNREKRIEKMVKHKIRKRGKSEKASNEIIKQTADLYIQEEMKKTGINTILIRKLRKIKNIDLQLLKKEPKTVTLEYFYHNILKRIQTRNENSGNVLFDIIENEMTDEELKDINDRAMADYYITRRSKDSKKRSYTKNYVRGETELTDELKKKMTIHIDRYYPDHWKNALEGAFNALVRELTTKKDTTLKILETLTKENESIDKKIEKIENEKKTDRVKDIIHLIKDIKNLGVEDSKILQEINEKINRNIKTPKALLLLLKTEKDDKLLLKKIKETCHTIINRIGREVTEKVRERKKGERITKAFFSRLDNLAEEAETLGGEELIERIKKIAKTITIEELIPHKEQRFKIINEIRNIIENTKDMRREAIARHSRFLHVYKNLKGALLIKQFKTNKEKFEKILEALLEDRNVKKLEKLLDQLKNEQEVQRTYISSIKHAKQIVERAQEIVKHERKNPKLKIGKILFVNKPRYLELIETYAEKRELEKLRDLNNLLFKLLIKHYDAFELEEIQELVKKVKDEEYKRVKVLIQTRLDKIEEGEDPNQEKLSEIMTELGLSKKQDAKRTILKLNHLLAVLGLDYAEGLENAYKMVNKKAIKVAYHHNMASSIQRMLVLDIKGPYEDGVHAGILRLNKQKDQQLLSKYLNLLKYYIKVYGEGL